MAVTRSRVRRVVEYGRHLTPPSKRTCSLQAVAVPSLCIVHSPGFANHRYLYLTRVLELGLDPLGEVLRHPEALVVRYLLGVDDDAQLTPGLDGEGLLDPFHPFGHLLELLEPLDVGLQDLAPRPGTGGRDGVGR